MLKIKKSNFSLFFLMILFVQCTLDDSTSQAKQKEDQASIKLFTILSKESSGIDFSNQITENKERNYFNFEYIYNGAGVAVGDINNDGLSDLFFVGNELANKLFLNKGELKFEDISAAAGVEGNGSWANGVSMVDINADGLLDIYVCKGGWPGIDAKKRENQLYINQGDFKFKEEAKRYGLNENGFSVQASFFDYDNDGDLDVYINNHPYAFNMSLEERLKIRKNPPDKVRDKLYKNNGNSTFTEVAKAAGISNYGHGLGIVTADINNDGWIDIYVANDYKEPDYLYINNGNGTFTDEIDDLMGHIAFNAMGVDIADINNDGNEDVFVSEMLPNDYKRSKTNMAPMNIKIFEGMKALGLHRQYMHNVLQINNGLSADGSSLRFSEVAQLAGVSKTDWSWSSLLSDFDNDGFRDLFVANGSRRDVFDRDYTTKVNRKAKEKGGVLDLEAIYKLMPSTKIPNQVYKNNGSLRFIDKTSDWGLDLEVLSQGAAVGDLDNDGDLDLVVNNLDEPSFIIQNNAEKLNNHYLNVKLKGGFANKNGLNAKVSLKIGKHIQYFESKVVRGFQSSSSSIVHFGLGDISKVDEVKVEWHNNRTSIINNVPADQTIVVDQTKATLSERKEPKGKLLFANNTNALIPPFVHRENKHEDYKVQILLPHKLSQNGPFISTGDINMDGLEDFFVGGAAGQLGVIYLQKKDGNFEQMQQTAFLQDKSCEDLGSCLFDADGDGDLDLFVVSGGSEFEGKSQLYQDRLYLNNGKGNFVKTTNRLPQMLSSCQSVSVCDFDQDGDLDLFVGGRVFPDHYPYTTPSYLLVNHKGTFADAAYTQGEGLNMVGMVTSSVWEDVDDDGDEDLIIVGEWMPIKIFLNEQGILKDATSAYGLEQTVGWWNKIIASDYDNDGDIDFIIGNRGLNHKFKANQEKPFHIYCGDYDGNGSYDIVLAKYDGSNQVPVRGRECSSEQMPFIVDKFPTYEAFANSDIKQLIGEALEDKLHYKASIFQSVILERTTEGFEVKNLPAESQISSVNGIVVSDLNGDGIKDLIMGGNMYHTEAETSRADASIGLVMLGQKNKTFKPLKPTESGFVIPGDVKDIQLLDGSGVKSYLVTKNDGALQVLRKN